MLHIPELFLMVLKLLSMHDLARCVLVNKQRRDASVPILWHTISFAGVCRKTLQGMVREDYLQAQELPEESRNDELTKNLPPSQGLIKIKVNVEPRVRLHQSSLSKYGPCIRNIENPQHLFHGLKLNSAMPSEQELLSRFLKHCIDIQELSLDTFDESDESRHNFKFIADCIAPNLRRLSMRNWLSYKSSSELYLYIISRCPPQLKKLDICDGRQPGFFGDVELTELENIARAGIMLSGLKELVLDRGYSKDEISSWDCFWKSCGNVERRDLKRWRHDMTDHMASRIRNCLPKVNSIVFEDMCNSWGQNCKEGRDDCIKKTETRLK